MSIYIYLSDLSIWYIWCIYLVYLSDVSIWCFYLMFLSDVSIWCIYLSTYLPIYLSTYLPIYPSTHLPIYLSTYLPIYLSTYLSIYPSIYLSMYLSIPHLNCHIYYQSYGYIYIYISDLLWQTGNIIGQIKWDPEWRYSDFHWTMPNQPHGISASTFLYLPIYLYIYK